MFKISKNDVLTKINALMESDATVNKAKFAMAGLQAQAEQATGAKRDDLMKEIQIAEGAFKRAVHENVVLPVYREMLAEFTDCVDAAAAAAKSWQAAYAEVMHPLNIHQFPALSCANTIVAGLVKGA